MLASNTCSPSHPSPSASSSHSADHPEDDESSKVYVSGLVIRDLPLLCSNWRSSMPLDAYLRRNKVVGISDIDTRKLTRILREKGAQNGCIVAGDNIDAAAAVAAAQGFPGLKGMDLAKEVTTGQPYEWAQGSWTLTGGLPEAPHPIEEKLPYHVVAYDYGVKRNILRMLVDRGCRITVVPAKTPASEVFKLKPDGQKISRAAMRNFLTKKTIFSFFHFFMLTNAIFRKFL